MFYCEDCRIENNYPESISGSMGSCELCGTSTICHDVPSSHLPVKDSPEDSLDVEDFIDKYVNEMTNLSHSTQILVLAFVAERLSLDKTATAIRDSLKK